MIRKKIFFFGTPEIAVPSLEALVKDTSVEIVGVGVLPDKPVGRKQKLTPCPVKVVAEELELPLFEIEDKDRLVKLFETQDFDLGIVIAFGMIFPESILHIPQMGVINVHFSLLPQYRGASPVQSALLNGDTISGITWQRMVAELDAGDVYFQKEYEIKNKTTGTLWEFFAQETATYFPEFLESYFKKQLKAQPQNEDEATFCTKFKKSDGEIHPYEESATTIYQKYLAFDPWPGIFLETTAGAMKLKKISKHTQGNDHLLPCKDASHIFIQEAQLPGKTPMPINEILRGHPKIFVLPPKKL